MDNTHFSPRNLFHGLTAQELNALPRENRETIVRLNSDGGADVRLNFDRLTERGSDAACDTWFNFSDTNANGRFDVGEEWSAFAVDESHPTFTYRTSVNLTPYNPEDAVARSEFNLRDPIEFQGDLLGHRDSGNRQADLTSDEIQAIEALLVELTTQEPIPYSKPESVIIGQPGQSLAESGAALFQQFAEPYTPPGEEPFLSVGEAQQLTQNLPMLEDLSSNVPDLMLRDLLDWKESPLDTSERDGFVESLRILDEELPDFVDAQVREAFRGYRIDSDAVFAEKANRLYETLGYDRARFQGNEQIEFAELRLLELVLDPTQIRMMLRD